MNNPSLAQFIAQIGGIWPDMSGVIHGAAQRRVWADYELSGDDLAYPEPEDIGEPGEEPEETFCDVCGGRGQLPYALMVCTDCYEWFVKQRFMLTDPLEYEQVHCEQIPIGKLSWHDQEILIETLERSL